MVGFQRFSDGLHVHPRALPYVRDGPLSLPEPESRHEDRHHSRYSSVKQVRTWRDAVYIYVYYAHVYIHAYTFLEYILYAK